MTSAIPTFSAQKRHDSSLFPRMLSTEPIIFVVDDDVSVRRLLCTVLRYASTAWVIEAADAESALCSAARTGRPIDLLISDVNLSSTMTGIDLARKLTSIEPSTKVLLMSGDEAAGLNSPLHWRFLEKPFPILSFLNCIATLCPSALPDTFAGNALAIRPAR